MAVNLTDRLPEATSEERDLYTIKNATIHYGFLVNSYGFIKTITGCLFEDNTFALFNPSGTLILAVKSPAAIGPPIIVGLGYQDNAILDHVFSISNIARCQLILSHMQLALLQKDDVNLSDFNFDFVSLLEEKEKLQEEILNQTHLNTDLRRQFLDYKRDLRKEKSFCKMLKDKNEHLEKELKDYKTTRAATDYSLASDTIFNGLLDD